MRYTITFPVRNRVKILDNFPVTYEGYTFLVESSDGLISAVGISKSGVSSSIVPKITPISEEEAKAYKQKTTDKPETKLSVRSELVSHIRSWQALLAPLTFVDIDFSKGTDNFDAEGDEEVNILSFKASNIEVVQGFEDFGIYARAFMGSLESSDIVEPTSFYLDARSAQSEGRHVHAYNSYYLFLETTFANGKFKEIPVVNEFLKSDKFMQAFEDGLNTALSAMKDSTPPFGLSTFNNPKDVIVEIVKLRGKLRHHSLKNKGRWNPHEQEKYKNEVYVLASICQSYLLVRASKSIWSDTFQEKYMRQAHEKGFKMECVVEITVMKDGLPRIAELQELSFPQSTMTSDLAIETLLKAIEIIRSRSPDVQIVTIRSFNKKNGMELFRYNLGGTIELSRPV